MKKTCKEWHVSQKARNVDMMAQMEIDELLELLSTSNGPIARARREQGMSVRQLAGLMGVSLAEALAIESGNAGSSSRETLDLIARIGTAGVREK